MHLQAVCTFKHPFEPSTSPLTCIPQINNYDHQPSNTDLSVLALSDSDIGIYKVSFSIARAGPSWRYFGRPSSALPGVPGPSVGNYEAHGHVDPGDVRKFLNPTITWIASLYLNCTYILQNLCSCTPPVFFDSACMSHPLY